MSSKPKPEPVWEDGCPCCVTACPLVDCPDRMTEYEWCAPVIRQLKAENERLKEALRRTNEAMSLIMRHGPGCDCGPQRAYNIAEDTQVLVRDALSLEESTNDS